MKDKSYESIYSQIGGDKTLAAAVDLFYNKVLADDRIKEFFIGVDMDRLRETQKAFLAYALGGPVLYSGRELREVHKHMNLTDEHFSAVQRHLHDTLQELNVRDDLIKGVLSITGSHHDDVLNL